MVLGVAGGVAYDQLRASTAAVGPGDPNVAYSVGQAVDIEYHGTWYSGRVLKAESGRYLVHYDGYSDSWDEHVDATRLRPRSAPSPDSGVAITPSGTAAQAAADAGETAFRYRAGDAVQILYGRTWYPGRVLRVEGGEYWVHYDGYSDSWDEKVGPHRLRSNKDR